MHNHAGSSRSVMHQVLSIMLVGGKESFVSYLDEKCKRIFNNFSIVSHAFHESSLPNLNRSLNSQDEVVETSTT
jgi:hypothetical protein